jgi:cytochrome b subunit of formate dehydrogenase
MSANIYPRFNIFQRLEHLLLLSSFTILAVTGLPQKYIGADWAKTMIGFMGGIEVVRQIHHFSAIVMMLESVYHLVSVGYRIFVRRVRLTMLPGLQDAQDAWQHLLYNLGARKHEPQGGRYTYMEKAEYWALVWGTVIMVITGFMMWNPIATTSILPGQFIPAAKTAHGGEAVLAVAAIILWHFYSVHLRNFNKSMFTGKLTEHEMEHEHPLELADLKAGKDTPVATSAQLKQRRQIYYPVAGVASVVLLFGLYGFISFEQTAITTVNRATTTGVYNPLTPTPIPTLRPTPTSIPLVPVWERNVGLLLQLKCGDCHGGDNPTAGLDLTTYLTINAGSQNGPVFIAGDPDNSLLIIKQLKSHPGKLTGFELEIVKEWIKAGAPRR